MSERIDVPGMPLEEVYSGSLLYRVFQEEIGKSLRIQNMILPSFKDIDKDIQDSWNNLAGYCTARLEYFLLNNAEDEHEQK